MSVTLLLLIVALVLAVISFAPGAPYARALPISVILVIVALLVGKV